MPKVHPPAKSEAPTKEENVKSPDVSTLPDEALNRETVPASDVEVPSQLDPSRPAGNTDYVLLSEYQALENRVAILEQHVLRDLVINPSDAVTEGERE